VIVFHASLETDLTVGNSGCARESHRCLWAAGRKAKEAGTSPVMLELQLELTRIVIDGRDYPVVSSDYTLQARGAARTLRRKWAVAAGRRIIGAIAGGGKGAAIAQAWGQRAGGGEACKVLTRGQQVKVPSETLLEFRLQQPGNGSPNTKPS